MEKIKASIIVIAYLLSLSWQTSLYSEELQNTKTLFDEASNVYQQEGAKLALPLYEAVLSRYQKEGDRLGEAITLGWIGNSHSRLGDPNKGLKFLNAALKIKQELDHQIEQGKTLSHIGLVYWEMGNYPDAISHFEAAIQIGKDQKNKLLQGSALNNISLVYDELGEYVKSMAGYEQVLSLYEGLDFPNGKSDALANIAGVHQLLGNYEKAITYYHKALEIDKALGLKPLVTSDYGNLGLCYLGLAEFEKAQDYFTKATLLATEIGSVLDSAYWAKGQANAQLNMGHYDEALDLYQKALKLYQQLDAKAELVETGNEIGELLLRLGDLTQAGKYFQQALSSAEEIKHHRGITQSLIALGNLHWYQHKYNEALSFYQRAATRAEAVGDNVRRVEALTLLGLNHAELGQIKEGKEVATQALEIAIKSDLYMLRAQAEFILGRLEQENSIPHAALKHYEKAQKLVVDAGDPDLLWRIHYQMGIALEATGKKVAAVEALQQAIMVIENVRSRLRQQRFRAGYLTDKHQVYEDLVRLQLELNRVEDAFFTGEKLRAQSFLTLLEGYRPDSDSKEDNKKRRVIILDKRIHKLREALISEQQQTIQNQRQAAIRVYSEELVQAETDYQSLLDDLSSRSRDYQPATDTTVAAKAIDVQNILLPGQALIEYVVGEGQVHIFVITSEHILATTVAVRHIDLKGKVELLRALLQQRLGNAWKKPARSLANLLIDPLLKEGWLKGINHLYIVPHGELNYLPFSVLLPQGKAKEQYLVADYITSYLPAAATLLQPSKSNKKMGSILAVAPESTRLKYAVKEVESIASLYPDANLVLTGNKASEAAFKKLASEYQILHLATHGRFNRLNPLLSGLELEAGDGEDGYLQVHEIMGLKLQAALVTLSACDTALASGHFNDVPAGDEFVGLTRAFLRAGSTSVFASLWEVNDHSTLEFMVNFYRQLNTKNIAGSVANVQRALANSRGPYSHPYYWAPYILISQSNKF